TPPCDRVNCWTVPTTHDSATPGKWRLLTASGRRGDNDPTNIWNRKLTYAFLASVLPDNHAFYVDRHRALRSEECSDSALVPVLLPNDDVSSSCSRRTRMPWRAPNHARGPPQVPLASARK